MDSKADNNNLWSSDQGSLGLNDKELFPSLPLETDLSIPTTDTSALMLSDNIPNTHNDSQRNIFIDSDSSAHDDEMSENDESDGEKSSKLFACANPNQPPAVVHEISSEEEEESDDDEDSSSSEDEDADHSEHFFKLAKEQYEQILKSEPDNDLIRRRLANLMASREAELLQNNNNSPNKEEHYSKKRKT